MKKTTKDRLTWVVSILLGVLAGVAMAFYISALFTSRVDHRECEGFTKQESGITIEEATWTPQMVSLDGFALSVEPTSVIPLKRIGQGCEVHDDCIDRGVICFDGICVEPSTIFIEAFPCVMAEVCYLVVSDTPHTVLECPNADLSGLCWIRSAKPDTLEELLQKERHFLSGDKPREHL